MNWPPKVTAGSVSSTSSRNRATTSAMTASGQTRWLASGSPRRNTPTIRRPIPTQARKISGIAGAKSKAAASIMARHSAGSQVGCRRGAHLRQQMIDRGLHGLQEQGWIDAHQHGDHDQRRERDDLVRAQILERLQVVLDQ